MKRTLLLVAMALSLSAICAAQNLLSGPQKIVAIDSAGIQTYFVQGAGFIDGMEIAGNRVYGVTIGRRVKGYDLESGLVAASVAIPGTGYLSSIVADSSGHLFISCPLRDEIYKLRLSDMAFWTYVGGHARRQGRHRAGHCTYDASDNSLLVTCFDTNTWVRIPLTASDVRTPAPRKAFLLHPNYPNPSTLGTRAAFALDTYAHTRPDVFDVSGRRLKVLVDEVRGPGNYSVPWDGTDDAGRPSGRRTYYIRLSVDGAAQAQKAVLLRWGAWGAKRVPRVHGFRTRIGKRNIQESCEAGRALPSSVRVNSKEVRAIESSERKPCPGASVAAKLLSSLETGHFPLLRFVSFRSVWLRR